jgi:hypothetical protein
MQRLSADEESSFSDAVAGLRRGDFSRLKPLFHPVSGATQSPQIIDWHRRGLFADEPQALAEALACACFLGCTRVADYLIEHGVDPVKANGTGLDAFHWAVNRGQLEVTRLLICHRAPLETRSMYGGTVLGTAIWSAINEPRSDHRRIIEELLSAGGRIDAVEYPTGHARIDALLQRYGAA